VSGFFKELFRTQIYKRRQGRIARQVTFAALCVGFVLGVWQVAGLMRGTGAEVASWFHTEPVTMVRLADGADETLKHMQLRGGEQAIVEALKKAGSSEFVNQETLLEETRTTRSHLEGLVSRGLIAREFQGESGKTTASIVSVIIMLVPFMFAALGIWVSFRVVNVHTFADFLIAVEAEMKKVSWPDSSTLTRSTIVVLVTIFFLAAILSLFDLFWQAIFTAIGIL